MPSHPKPVHDCGQCMSGQCMTGLLAAVFTYGTYSWPVGGSNEPQAATKKLHFHPKPKRGSGRRKSRKRKTHQPKPKKLQVLESIVSILKSSLSWLRKKRHTRHPSQQTPPQTWLVHWHRVKKKMHRHTSLTCKICLRASQGVLLLRGHARCFRERSGLAKTAH